MNRVTECAGLMALLLVTGLRAQVPRSDLAATGSGLPGSSGASMGIREVRLEGLTQRPMSRGERQELFEKAKGFKSQAGEAWRRSQLDTAVVHLRKILALGLPDEPSSRRLLASVSLTLADVLKQLRRWGEAEKTCALGLEYLNVPEIRSDHLQLELFELHAELLDQLGRRPEAEKARERYLTLFRERSR